MFLMSAHYMRHISCWAHTRAQ